MQISQEHFSDFMRKSLYGEEGFYTKGGGAGRERDYMTSPEVGDLFGFVIANYIDDWYKSLETQQATIIEVGCGPGSLAASIGRSNLSCSENIHYCLVDISPENRKTSEQKLSSISPVFEWSIHETIPTVETPTLVIANELLDNLVFNIGNTSDVYKSYKPDEIEHIPMPYQGAFGRYFTIDNLGPASITKELSDYRIPLHVGMGEWFEELANATTQVGDLSVLFFDYMKSVIDMEDENWLRLYANSKRIVGVDAVLDALENGARGDITTDVTLEDVYVILDSEGFSKITDKIQKQWLIDNGIDTFIENDSPVTSSYDQIASMVKGDSKHLQTKSFALEYDALTSEEGLGTFTVVSARRQV